MKKILLILLVILSGTVFAQNLKDKTVLGHFVLGVDSFDNVLVRNNIAEYNVYEVVDVANIKKITLNEYRYNGSNCRIILLFVNDLLYGLRYYPAPFNYTYELKELKLQFANNQIDDREYYRKFISLSNQMHRYDNKLKDYKKYLDTRFNRMQTMGDDEDWMGEYFNSDIQIEFDVDGNYDESFVHYSTVLLKKYPQYKNF